jgi:adenylate kinase family enzyme
MKIAVIGHLGSGKTTLAERISKKLGIPHIHLDRVWLESGAATMARHSVEWQQARLLVKEKFEEAERGSNWVSDGWQEFTVPYAERVVFVDIPAWRRFFNMAHRTVFNRRHPEISVWDDLRFLFSANYRAYKLDKKFRAFAETYKSKTTVLHNYKEAEEYISKLN